MCTAEEWVATDYPIGPHVSFIGGFDPEDIARNPKKRSDVLVLSYPIESPDQLKQELGSIDLR
jgi:hypothetical protein